MLLFRSEEHVRAWYDVRGKPLGALLTLGQQWDLAHAWYANRLPAEWRRRSPEEAQALLTSLGLTGPFWELSPGR